MVQNWSSDYSSKNQDESSTTFTAVALVEGVAISVGLLFSSVTVRLVENIAYHYTF
ncbi:hypothetical protein E4U24_006583 [Claviceps purpurea]|nr:hypothetical protein E4U38_002227 [Claviceps purpurea]KAG6155563.1 hypothetical protein E4U37_001101 [Claviceps purpurea]KAG6163660.1 hypothetical protein E4U11_001739 [Claviceps purpurea]KAG6240180.1 hypothetical protein E4U24_006583 [Claviceps purpurea]